MSSQVSFTIPAAGGEVLVRRRRVKNLNLRVTRSGVVELSIPLTCPRSYAERFVSSREAWIERSLELVRKRAEQESCRFVSGETIELWGEKRVLEVVPAKGKRGSYELDGSALVLHVPAERLGDTDEALAYRRALVLRMRRDELLRVLPDVVERCQERVGVRCDDWRVREMVSRWGSCVVARRRIWLSLELTRFPLRSLEYVACHELCHLIVADHSPAFYVELERSCPDWREQRALLNGRSA
jgi:predicted metal-dependent hydrolase